MTIVGLISRDNVTNINPNKSVAILMIVSIYIGIIIRTV